MERSQPSSATKRDVAQDAGSLGLVCPVVENVCRSGQGMHQEAGIDSDRVAGVVQKLGARAS